MAKRPSSREGRRTTDDEDEENGEGWKSWVRDIAVAVLIMVVVLAAIFAYTQVWPPLVVVESSSMQHGDTVSYVGVIDTGDLVFVQAAPARSDVVTYLEGRAAGYATYGDYGDVIVFRLALAPQETPIIHRAILYLIPNGTFADVPALAGLPTTQWEGFRNGLPVQSAYNLSAVTIHGMGYNHDLGITFNLAFLVSRYHTRGYVTMGDNNAYHECFPSKDPCTSPNPYDTGWFPAQGDIIGRARGEIPWFGLIKLLLAPTGQCARYWGDTCAPQNSWDSLAIALVVLISLPFLLELAVWAWGRYAWPRLRPYFRRRQKPEAAAREPDALDDLEDLEAEEPQDEPKEGSSGP